ncbi:MAG TPA: response regulator [Candidatus Xenobia bacterium]
MSSKAILIVDDNRDLRLLMERVVGRAGYPVLHAVNGLSAMRLINDRPYDIGIVICDVILPDIHGANLLDSLNALRPGVQGVLITGDPDAVPSDCLWDVLVKPFPMAELLRYIRALEHEQPTLEAEPASVESSLQPNA